MSKSPYRHEVYRNLHTGLWSVRSSQTGLVVLHAESVILQDCKLVVQKAGRERVLQEKRKNVHAFVVGTLVGLSGRANINQDRQIFMKEARPYKLADMNKSSISYNPYKAEHFIAEDLQNTPAISARQVELSITSFESPVIAYGINEPILAFLK